MNKAFAPLRRLRKPRPRYPAWYGNIAAPGKLVTDGHMLIDVRAIADMDLIARLAAPPDIVRHSPCAQAYLRQFLARLSKPATAKLRVLGWVACERPTAILLSDPDGVYPIDARLLRLVMDATGAGRFRGAAPDSAVIAYRGRRRVAAIMPMSCLGAAATAALERWRAENKP